MTSCSTTPTSGTRAARATADGGRRPSGVTSAGSWHGGTRLDVGHGTDDFVKNALR